MMRLVLVLLAVMTGCFATEPDCASGEKRCNGSVLESCDGHPGGVYGPVDDPSYVHGSGAAWETVADCGANLCVVPPSGTAFCALDTTPHAACATTDYACDGTMAIECREGYVVERRACNACDQATGECDIGAGEGCADQSCGASMQCNSDPYATCEMACTCPEGAVCDECDASWSKAPDGGGGLQWTCKAGLCAFHY